MEIVLLYKFYIFSFLNLKEGGREGGKEGRKEGSWVSNESCSAQLLPGKWPAQTAWKMQLGYPKVTELDLVYQWAEGHYFHNSIYNKDQTFYNISTLTPEGSNKKCLLASL